MIRLRSVVGKDLEFTLIPLPEDVALQALRMTRDLILGVGPRRLVRDAGINYRAVCGAGDWPELLGLMGAGIKWEVW